MTPKDKAALQRMLDTWHARDLVIIAAPDVTFDLPVVEGAPSIAGIEVRVHPMLKPGRIVITTKPDAVPRDLDAEKRLATIIDDWGPMLRRLSGLDDVVTGVCPECQFEQGRPGGEHSPICSRNEEERDG